jgi:hypothetical protein
MNQKALAEQLIHYEKALANGQCPTNISTFDTLISENFIEISRHGILYGKQAVVDWLNSNPCIHYELKAFKVRFLNKTHCQLMYLALKNKPNHSTSLRSSIWTQTEAELWQLAFHQGTPLEP